MRYIFVDTLNLLIFEVANLILKILFPVKWLLRISLYTPTVNYYTHSKRISNFNMDISKLQKLSVRQLKEKLGGSILGLFISLFLFFYLTFSLFVNTNLVRTEKLYLSVFPILFGLPIFPILKNMFFYLYALVTKKGMDSPDQVLYYNWYQDYKREGANLFIPTLIILLIVCLLVLKK